MNLLELPREILLNITSYLNVEDILRISMVCRKLNDVTYDEKIWRFHCLREFDTKPGPDATYTARALFLKLLRPYGSLIGLWQASVKFYGGIIKIELIDGKIEANEIYAPFFSAWKDPLKVKKLFSIGFDPTGERVQVFYDTGQEAAITFQNDNEEFNIQLLNSNKPARDLKLREKAKFYIPFMVFVSKFVGVRSKEFKRWLIEQDYGEDSFYYPSENPSGLLSRFLFLRNFKNSCSFTRRYWPAEEPGFPVQPGLFKSDYDESGPELIMLTYETDDKREGPKAVAIKITGDANVPAGKVTFFANLDYPLHHITYDDQQDIETLCSIKAEKVPYTPESFLSAPPQPFRIADDLQENLFFQDHIPQTSIGRFQGQCQLAYPGYKNPSFSEGHWVIFDPDTFGFIFLELNNLCMYFRVVEPSLN